MNSILYIFLLAFSLVGFAIARYISTSKQKKKPLICRKKEECDHVVNSDYAFFLGFPVEQLGARYYSLLAVLAAFLIVLPGFRFASLILVLVFCTLAGALFSLYLIGIQVFKIKKFCLWCLGSALISFLLLVTTLLIAFH